MGREREPSPPQKRTNPHVGAGLGKEAGVRRRWAVGGGRWAAVWRTSWESVAMVRARV